MLQPTSIATQRFCWDNLYDFIKLPPVHFLLEKSSFVVIDMYNKKRKNVFVI